MLRAPLATTLWIAAGSLACGPSRAGGSDAAVGYDSAGHVDAHLDATEPLPDAPSGVAVGVPGATFMMGCNQTIDSSCDADESPYHAVTLPAFAIDRTEVTQAAYQQCVAASACTPPSANFDPTGHAMYPVTNVTWQQAVTYCGYAGARLPTEAEWELAARGTDGRIYPWGSTAANCTLANVAGTGCPGVVEMVGSHPTGASPYGALDMTGNVWEWVADYYDAAYYASSPASSPAGPAAGSSRVYRGGSSGNDGTLGRASNRASTYSPTVGGSGLGFRCAR